jgi:hypothetical protein
MIALASMAVLAFMISTHTVVHLRYRYIFQIWAYISGMDNRRASQIWACISGIGVHLRYLWACILGTYGRAS